jgi:hypothetical protein
LVIVDGDSDGSPQGERRILIWNPPKVDNDKDKDSDKDKDKDNDNADINNDNTDINYDNKDNDITKTKVIGDIIDNGHIDDNNIEDIILISNTDITHKNSPNIINSTSPLSFKEQCNARPTLFMDQSNSNVTIPTSNLVSPSKFIEQCSDRVATIGSPTKTFNSPNKARKVLFNRGGNRRKKVFKIDDGNNNEDNDNNVSCEETNKSNEFKKSIHKVGSSRKSSLLETSLIFTSIIKLRIRTIAFCGTRKLVELVLKYSLQEFNSTSFQFLSNYVSSYRGGYTLEERRKLENHLFNGHTLGVCSTSALELGVDIGDLDVSIHMGFQGSISIIITISYTNISLSLSKGSNSSLLQQVGRVGRSGKKSISILVCFDSPIDQYISKNPSFLYDLPFETAFVDINNPYILKNHMLCASKEIPLNTEFNLTNNIVVNDRDIWGIQYEEIIGYLLKDGHLYHINTNNSDTNRLDNNNLLFLHPGYPQSYPSRDINIRMIDPITIKVSNRL